MFRSFFALVILVVILVDTNAFYRTMSRIALPGIHSLQNTRLQAIKDIQSADEFDSLRSKSSSSMKPIVIDFQKSKCRPCIKAAPIYEAISYKYADVACFYKIDADSWSGALQLMKANGVKSVPTFQIWVGGQLVETFEGVKLAEVDNFLHKYQSVSV